MTIKIIIASVISTGVIIFIFSGQKFKYECSGEISSFSRVQNVESLIVIIEKYNFIKKWYTNSEGKMSHGGSLDTLKSYTNIVITYYGFYLSPNANSKYNDGSMSGQFSTVTNDISFYVEYEGYFEGKCTNIN